MRRAVALAMLAAICLSEPALAQGSRITGTVRSADGTGQIVGATVVVVGSKAGAVTRDDGRYSIAVEPGTYKVRAGRIGFSPDSVVGVVVRSGAVVTADFSLKQSTLQLSGVVVTGYGTRDVRDVTGVVDMVKEKDFNTGRVVSAEQLVQSKVPGVQVIESNEPGGGIAVRIRGGTSVNASNDPLFVIDNVPIVVGGGVSSGRNPMNFLNPNDIQSITVLKDASATAIYGSRGANGVVMITTKSGAAGPSQFTYSSNYSTSSIVRRPQMLSTTEFAGALQQYAPENVGKVGNSSTDWLGAVLRSSGGQEQNIAFSGSKDDMRYRLSLGYLSQDGILQGTTAQRTSLGLTYSDLLLGDRIELRANLKGSKADDRYTPGAVLYSATQMAPTAPIRNADGTYFQYASALSTNNPLSDLALISDRGSVYRSVGNLEAKYRLPFIDGLTASLLSGYDFAQSQRTTFSPSTSATDVKTGRGGRFDSNNPRQMNTVLEVFANYAPKVDAAGNKYDVTAGYTYEESQGNYPSYYAQGLSTDLLGANGVPSAKTYGNFLDIQQSKLISLFGRLNYRFHDRYLLTTSIRRDGSSRFGPGNQWGVFPSFALAWRMVDEPFMQKFRELSELKLRASWGVNGNQSFGNYLFLPTYSVGNAQAQYPFGDQYIPIIRPSAVDPNIKWEQTTSTNLGLDFGLRNDRITGTIDWYTKKTTDLIFTVPVAAGTNLSNFVTTNIGSMQNTGFELGLNMVVFDGRRTPWRWDASFAVSTNANKILSVSGSGSDQILTGGIAGGVGSTIQVLQPGQPINSFFVYRHKTGADGKPVGGNASDKDMYVDQNGDGVINQSDRVAYKSPAPKWIIGHTSTASYRNWDFSLTARAYLGNYVYNNIASNLGNYSALKGIVPTNLDRSVLKYGFVNPQYFSDLYVEDASFLRLDNVSAGYTFRNFSQFKSLRVYGTIQNAFTSTKYSGVDPVSGVNGIDNNLYPLSRTFTAGLNIGF